VHLHQLPNQRQADAQTALRMIKRTVHLPERVENMREHFPIDADPGIPNPQHDIPPWGFGRQPDPAARLCILGRIIQEVVQHLLQPNWVSVHGYGLPREDDLELVTTLFDGGAHRLDRIGYALRQIQWFLAQVNLAVLDARDLQQIIDQTADAPCLPFYQAQDGLSRGGIVPI
jgi:hypothetical protein